MKFKQFYLGCLSHASYYLGSGSEAVIIDPQRDIQQYLDEAELHQQRIIYVIETHSHADFVSGHLELAAKTGAKIIYGQRADTTFPTHKVKDGDEISIGDISLKFFETPGHTPEGITILARETGNDSAPAKLFTGDTLFIGDVGRPDLIGSAGYTAEDMGGMLYDSLHDKILPLPDNTEIYPAHGAGSLCGKSLSKETWSTLGDQKKNNYALQPMTKEKFIEIVASDQPSVPAYFASSAAQNLHGSLSLEDLPKPILLNTDDITNFDGIVLDVRPGADFGAAHIPNAVNIGLGGQFATWAGTLISIGTPVAVAAETKEQVEEAFTRLARVGIETVKGYMLMKDFRGKTRTVKQVTPIQARSAVDREDTQFIDVRNLAEHAAGHAVSTINLPLNNLSREINHLDPEKPTYVICQSGYRSSIATSLLENAGFKNIYNVTGGTKSWTENNLETEVSASTCTTDLK